MVSYKKKKQKTKNEQTKHISNGQKYLTVRVNNSNDVSTRWQHTSEVMNAYCIGFS